MLFLLNYVVSSKENCKLGGKNGGCSSHPKGRRSLISAAVLMVISANKRCA